MPQTSHDDLSSMIASLPLFAQLPPEQRERLLHEGRMMEFAASETLIGEDEDNPHLFLVLEGSASALINGTPVGTISASELAGEISSAGISPPVATVIANEDLKAIAFPVGLIRDLADRQQDFAAALRQTAFRRISG